MENKIVTDILHWKPVSVLVDFSKKIVLPGFDRLPLFEVITFFIRGLQKGSLTTRAAALAFNFFLAIFPGLIFLFTLIPYIPIDDFQYQLLHLMEDVLPYNAYESLKLTIEDLVTRQRGGLLSFGFILAMYFATNGFNSMITAFNNSYHINETRSIWMQILTSFALMFIITTLIFLAISLIVFSGIVLSSLTDHGILKNDFEIILLQSGKWLIVLALLFFCFSFMYYIGPSKKSKFRFISAGSTLSTILSIFTSLGFAFYVNNFGQYNKLYGSIGTIMVILLWIYFNTVILLIGFELNASIKNASRERC
jgi:membrane protein